MQVVEKFERRSAALLLLAAVALVACTSGSGTRPDPPGPSGSEAIALAPYAQRFAAIVAPLEAAGAVFASRSAALRPSAVVGDFQLVAAPFARAVVDAEAELRQATWPAIALRDIKIEMAAEEKLRSELLGTLDVTLMAPLWRQQVVRAADRASRARRIVSIDLGILPPG